MRSMLIPILLCSLASLVQSDKKATGCETGGRFKCFGPKMCLDDTITMVSGEKLIEVDTEDIKAGCPAIVKFHQYQEHWSYVSIESFDAGTSPVVLITSDDTGNKKSEFKCALNSNGQMEFSYTGKAISVVKTYDQVTDPLVCSFELKLEIDKKIFGDTDSDDVAMMTAGGADTAHTKHEMKIRQCDPSDWKFEPERNLKYVYTELLFKPGEYYCDDANRFKIQYRKERSKPYELAPPMTCLSKKFTFGPDKYPPEDWLYIRCMAEAKYFCDYDVKNKGALSDSVKHLERTPPIPTSNQISALKCPDGYPHLYIGEHATPLANPKIECLNYGGTQLWTVNDNINLTPEGPATYCSNSIACHIRNEILGKSVTNGFVNENHRPECHEKGTLTVGGKEVTVRCDEPTGQFKYAVKGGTELPVAPDTQFVCTYPKEDRSEENAQNQKTLMTGVFSVVGVVIVVFIVAALAVWLLGRRIKKRNAAKIKKETEYGLNKFCNPEERMTQNNKSKNKKNNNNDNEEKKEKKEEMKPEPMKWNKLMMHIQYVQQERSPVYTLGSTNRAHAIVATKNNKAAAIVKCSDENDLPHETTTLISTIDKDGTGSYDSRLKIHDVNEEARKKYFEKKKKKEMEEAEKKKKEEAEKKKSE